MMLINGMHTDIYKVPPIDTPVTITVTNMR